MNIGYELANKRVTLRLDGHLISVVHYAVPAKALLVPLDAGEIEPVHV